MREIFFIDGVRTPFGRAGENGIYWGTRADDLAVKALRGLLERHPQLPVDRIDDVGIAATSQQGDQGLTLGRSVALLAGLPQTVPGYALDRMCAGSMTVAAMMSGAIGAGQYDLAIAGGVEHMGRHPFGAQISPNPRFLAEKLVDADALNMGSTAERLHDRFPHLTRERADRFGMRSQHKAQAAYERGDIQSDLIPVATRHADGWGLAVEDQGRRPETTMETLAGLSTPFRPHGRVTAGTSSPLTDGATMSLFAGRELAHELGLTAKMRLRGFAFAGVEAELMGLGPIPATEKVLKRTGLTIADIGLFELNEAFAVQVLSFLDAFDIDDDDPRVNPWGGAIAFGHPLAASGIRLMMQLAKQFSQRPDVRYGLTAMCVGLGQGGAMVWENPHFDGKEGSLQR